MSCTRVKGHLDRQVAELAISYPVTNEMFPIAMMENDNKYVFLVYFDCILNCHSCLPYRVL